jgi:hypothetical protein
MNGLISAPRPASPISFAKLLKTAFDGHDLKPLRAQILARIQSHPTDVAALMDLCVIEQLLGDRASGLQHQTEALKLERLYRSSWPVSSQALHVLAFMAPGDIGSNTPIEFLLENSDVVLHMLYVIPGQPIPEPLPDHAIAIVTPCESGQNRRVLREIERLIQNWPCPVLNQPSAVSQSSREQLHFSLRAVQGLMMPATARVGRAALEQTGVALKSLDQFLSNGTFPLICRPIDSHAGRALVKLDSLSSIAPYLAGQPDAEFFISPFIDYRSADGWFRKYRIVWIDGLPYPVHMAISDDWKVWYYNAGMAANAAKRNEEEHFMATFDTGFAVRHAAALAAIAERFGLEYFGIDCAELPNGSLLVFEGGNNLVVHDMDPPDLYPYKSPHMQKLFAAFREMLKNKGMRASVGV